jgi:hypothetical protein
MANAGARIRTMGDTDKTYEKVPRDWSQVSISGEKIAWIGHTPVLSSSFLSIRDTNNYRFGPSLHGIHDSVYLVEEQLHNFGETWQIVLDEAIRLLKEEGHIVIRIVENDDVNRISLKQFLGRSITFETKLVDQVQLESDTFLITFKIKRLNFEKYVKKDWTFGILSNGKNKDQVRQLVETITALERQDTQILVAGPSQPGLDVEYCDIPISDNLARIAEKKNLILAQAISANICILHDRFLLNKNFIDVWERYGYDFDVATMPQFDLLGQAHPSLPWFPKDQLSWQPPHYSKQFSYHRGSFINGGVTIGKTHVLKRLGYNELLLHEEAEDVELSRQIRHVGLALKYNDFGSITVLNSRPNYMNHFILQPAASQKSFRLFVLKSLLSVYLKLPRTIRETLKGSSRLRKILHVSLD